MLREPSASREMSRALLTLFVLGLLAGCGSGSSGSTDSSDGTKLMYTVWSQGKTGKSKTYVLDCSHIKGATPEARAACSNLKRIDAAVFAPVPAGTACTEIYGGPQIARVSGRLRGEAIKADFKRTNGCEIARWEQLLSIFPLGA